MTALLNLYDVQKATFGTQAGDEPDVYADYDRLVELCGKMADATQEVEDLTRLLDGLNAPTHGGPDQGDSGPLVSLSLAGRVAALVERLRRPVFGVVKEVAAERGNVGSDTDSLPLRARLLLGDLLADDKPPLPAGPRHHLIRAAALIVAEIERLDREEAAKAGREAFGDFVS